MALVRCIVVVACVWLGSGCAQALQDSSVQLDGAFTEGPCGRSSTGPGGVRDEYDPSVVWSGAGHREGRFPKVPSGCFYQLRVAAERFSKYLEDQHHVSNEFIVSPPVTFVCADHPHDAVYYSPKVAKAFSGYYFSSADGSWLAHANTGDVFEDVQNALDSQGKILLAFQHDIVNVGPTPLEISWIGSAWSLVEPKRCQAAGAGSRCLPLQGRVARIPSQFDELLKDPSAVVSRITAATLAEYSQQNMDSSQESIQATRVALQVNAEMDSGHERAAAPSIAVQTQSSVYQNLP